MRVAPIRVQTIPRLALLLASLMSMTIKALSLSLELEAPRYYGDSQVALYWIREQGKQWKPFVQNRAIEIAKLTDKSSWRHCPGKENPANLPSRGITPIELSVSALWRFGPPWIKGGDNALSPEPADMHSDCVSELKGTGKANNTHILLIPSPAIGIGKRMSCQDFSSLLGLFRVTMHVIKLARTLIKATTKVPLKEALPENVEAERLWAIEAQTAVIQDTKFDISNKTQGRSNSTSY